MTTLTIVINSSQQRNLHTRLKNTIYIETAIKKKLYVKILVKVFCYQFINLHIQNCVDYKYFVLIIQVLKIRYI